MHVSKERGDEKRKEGWYTFPHYGRRTRCSMACKKSGKYLRVSQLLNKFEDGSRVKAFFFKYYIALNISDQVLSCCLNRNQNKQKRIVT